MAPNLLKTIAKRVIKQRTVAQALENRRKLYIFGLQSTTDVGTVIV
jgi:hypothetical protein